MAMTPRERALTALRRRQPDRVPMNIRLTPPMVETLKARTGFDDPAEYFDCEVRNVTLLPTARQNDFSRYHGRQAAVRVDEWGVGWIQGALFHFTEMIHPMAELTSPGEVDAYPWPDVTADYRYEGFAESIRRLKARGYAVRGRLPEVDGTIYETAWRLRGLERFLVDLVENKRFANRLMGTIADIQCENARKFARAGVDIMHFSEDFGTQRALFMSAGLWREMIMPHLKRLFDAVKAENPEVLVFLHSDGNVEELIPGFIEIGVDILNPVQPECMDPARVKLRFGDRLAFWGTIGTQTTLPLGTPDQVREVVKERVRTVGKGGGLLLGPTHQVQPDVPWENLMAFAHAVREYGVY